jgi:hypothetical protein
VVILKNIGNALLGALLSVIAFYLLIAGYELTIQIASFGWSGIKPTEALLGAPFYVLIFVYWILIPVGLLSGFVIPLLVRKKTRREALFYGVLTGIVVGLLFATLIAYDFAVGSTLAANAHSDVQWWSRFGRQFASSLPLTIGYCSIWTTAYALSKAGEPLKRIRSAATPIGGPTE